MSEKGINFEQTHSFVDSSFFIKLSKLKLDVMKLDDSSTDIYGVYNYSSLPNNASPSLSLSESSFSSLKDINENLPQGSSFVVPGRLMNVNTINDFKSIKKRDLLMNSGNMIFNSIKNKGILSHPELLSSFFLLSFAELKKYRFYYWLCCPHLHSKFTSRIVSDASDEIRSYKDTLQHCDDAQIKIIDHEKAVSLTELFNYKDNIVIAFNDTSTKAGTSSYVLGNLISALSYYGYSNVRVFVNHANSKFDFIADFNIDTSYNIGTHITGWERTSKGRLGPKLANLGTLINPKQLADESVDLNLKLMKWRVSQKLDLDIVKNCKCLLLGAGTLGSYVARGLLAWGIRKITFVDNGKVSFSNPVRQPLYDFSDCTEGGKEKAEAAAANLKKIFPGVDARGYNLKVPMAGHPVSDEKSEKHDFDLLCKLFDEHDAIFILMDSRETRWLPTVLGNVKNKIVMDSAIGFDSFLVMRHGSISPDIPLESQQENRLGCYFCNDVYAPSDSLSDRTLDQMCTVTRPGIAMMASSLTVELFISILESPDKQYSSHNVSSNGSILGSLPHQIRGFVQKFNILKLKAKNFKYCSACSIPVIEAFEKNGWNFVKEALNNPTYLEDLVGLTKLHNEAEKAALQMESFEDSDEDTIS